MKKKKWTINGKLIEKMSRKDLIVFAQAAARQMWAQQNITVTTHSK